LKTKFDKNSKEPWPKNDGSLLREDQYIDGMDEVGKLARGSPEPIIIEKEKSRSPLK
jgi:hypothetical protein